VGDATLLGCPLCFTTVQMEIAARVARSATPPIIRMTERRLSPKIKPSSSGFGSGYVGSTIGSTGSMIGCTGSIGSIIGSIGSSGSSGSTTGSTGSVGSGTSIWAS